MFTTPTYFFFQGQGSYIHQPKLSIGWFLLYLRCHELCLAGYRHSSDHYIVDLFVVAFLVIFFFTDTDFVLPFTFLTDRGRGISISFVSKS